MFNLDKITRNRIFGLDVVRAFSIVLVLIAHRFNCSYEYGIVGVQVFFVLSGFLIGQILIKDFGNGGNLSTITGFWRRRWFRTLPLYYLILTFRILFYGNPYGWKIIVYFLFLQANFVGIGFFSVSWSLVVEEWFYVFLPIATFLFFQKRIKGKQYMNFLFFFIAFFFCARFLWNYYHKGIIIYQFDCLLLGVLVALCKTHFISTYKKLNSLPVFLIGLTGIVIFTLLLGKMDEKPLYSVFYRVIWYTCVSIFIAFAIPFIEQSPIVNGHLKKNRPLLFFFTWTSILTYSIYLIHMDVFHIYLFSSDTLNLISQAIILYLFSMIIYVFYEHPMTSLRDDFSLNRYVSSVKSFFKG